MSGSIIGAFHVIMVQGQHLDDRLLAEHLKLLPKEAQDWIADDFTMRHRRKNQGQYVGRDHGCVAAEEER